MLCALGRTAKSPADFLLALAENARPTGSGEESGRGPSAGQMLPRKSACSSRTGVVGPAHPRHRMIKLFFTPATSRSPPGSFSRRRTASRRKANATSLLTSLRVKRIRRGGNPGLSPPAHHAGSGPRIGCAVSRASSIPGREVKLRPASSASGITSTDGDSSDSGRRGPEPCSGNRPGCRFDPRRREDGFPGFAGSKVHWNSRSPRRERLRGPPAPTTGQLKCVSLLSSCQAPSPPAADDRLAEAGGATWRQVPFARTDSSDGLQA